MTCVCGYVTEDVQALRAAGRQARLDLAAAVAELENLQAIYDSKDRIYGDRRDLRAQVRIQAATVNRLRHYADYLEGEAAR